jgi:hypothetical protein
MADTAPTGEAKNDPPFTNPAGATTSSKTATPGITTIRTPQQINDIATSDVNSSIAAQTAPMQAQIDTLGSDQTAAAAAIKNMFGSLLPAVSTGAANVKSAYDEAEVNQNAIFAAAQAQLSQLKQTQAQRAQALAQEMGGPVALSEFTAGLGEQQSLLSNLGAGQMLHTLGYAQAGEQQAQAFAGQVFPVMQTEQQAQSKKYYDDQVKTLNDQITQLKATAGDKITAEKNDLIGQERAYALQKTQQKLDAVKAQRDWLATKRTLANDDKRVALAQKQAALQESGVTGTYKGKPTQQAKALTVQEKNQAHQLGLSDKEYALRKQQLATSTRIAQQKIAVSRKNSWAQLLDNATNPQVGKTVKQTTTVSVPAPAALSGKVKDAYKDPSSPTGYSRLVTTYSTPQTSPITNPNDLVDYLVANQMPQGQAVKMVKARFGATLKNWSYKHEGVWPPKAKIPNPTGAVPAPARAGSKLGPTAPGKTKVGGGR